MPEHHDEQGACTCGEFAGSCVRYADCPVHCPAETEHHDEKGTVVTVEQLDELPVGSVVLTSNHGGAHERFASGWGGAGDHVIRPSALLATVLPARVLWIPGGVL